MYLIRTFKDIYRLFFESVTFIEFDRFLKSFVDFINLWMTLIDFYFKKLFCRY